jgi:hypothetical protein
MVPVTVRMGVGFTLALSLDGEALPSSSVMIAGTPGEASAWAIVGAGETGTAGL